MGIPGGGPRATAPDRPAERCLSRRTPRLAPVLAIALLTLVPATAEAGPPGVQILAIKGDIPVGGDGLPIATLGIPVSDGSGRAAFTGTLEDGAGGDGFVWRDGEILWRHSFAPPPPPVGISPFMGLGDDDQYVFRSLVEGLDALWSHNGLLLRRGDPAPGLPSGTVIEFSRRAMLTPDGTALWVSEFRDAPGPNGLGQALYVSPDASPVDIAVVLRSGDLVEGLPIARPIGLDTSFRASRNLEHLVHVIQLDTGSNDDDGALYVDGEIALREGEVVESELSGQLEHWARFRRVSINNAGNYLVSGTTDAPQANDFVIAYNGKVVLREGQRVGGVRLEKSATVLGLDLDDRGRAVHVWSTSGFGPEYLMFACDATNLEDSQLLLTVPDNIEGKKFIRFSDIGHGPVVWLSPQDTHIRIVADIIVASEDGFELIDAILSVELPVCDEQHRFTAAQPTTRAAAKRR